jgi:diacylglycerol kinase family enzyme
VAATDAEVGAIVERVRQGGEQGQLPEIGLIGGDLCRTLGGLGDVERLRQDTGTRATLDVVRARLDGTDRWFVAHLVARRPLWQGRFVVAMNAESLGEWKVAPRAHPGDGVVDVIEGALPWRARLQARRRARSGDHLPHPRLTTKRVSRFSATFRRPTAVWLDGVRVGMFRCVELSVEADALPVVV